MKRAIHLEGRAVSYRSHSLWWGSFYSFVFLGFFSYISLCFLFSYHWAWCHNWFVSKVFLINQCFSKVDVKNVNEGYDWWQKLRIPKINGEEVLEGVPFFSLCYSFNSSKYTANCVSTNEFHMKRAFRWILPKIFTQKSPL